MANSPHLSGLTELILGRNRITDDGAVALALAGCIAIGYPVAYFTARLARRSRGLLLAALVLVIAWPAKPAEMVMRIAIAAVLTFGVLMADTPFSMAAWLWEALVRAHEPDRTSPLIWWNIFLNGGGRLALGLIAAVLSIGMAQQACAGRRSASRVAAEGRVVAPHAP